MATHRNIQFQSDKYCVTLTRSLQTIYGGRFATLEEAIAVRDRLEAQYPTQRENYRPAGPRRHMFTAVSTLAEPFTYHQVVSAAATAGHDLSQNDTTTALIDWKHRGWLELVKPGGPNKPAWYRRSPKFPSDLFPVQSAPAPEPAPKLSSLETAWRAFRATIVIPPDPLDYHKNHTRPDAD